LNIKKKKKKKKDIIARSNLTCNMSKPMCMETEDIAWKPYI
jgi:hypothetical protein